MKSPNEKAPGNEAEFAAPAPEASADERGAVINLPNAETGVTRRQVVGRIGWGQAFSAFRHRNYRIFFGGQVISLIGTWLQTTAEGWLVYQLSGSSVALGAIRFANMLPFALLALYGGTVADRHPKRHILLGTQAASMLLALLLAALVYTGVIEVWHVAVIGFSLGVVNAFDVPARQSIVVELVGKEDLTNGIALNASMFNLARVTGPALAGILIGIIGMAGCFLLNGLSYIAVLLSYLMLRLPKAESTREPQPFVQATKEAFRYIAGHGPLRGIMILISTFSTFGISALVLMPVFAKDLLGGDATSFGLLMACNGGGALLGGLSLASWGNRFSRRRRIYAGLFGCCLFLSLFALSKIYWLSCALLLCAGYCMIVFLATANTATQLRSPDALRGRIMGFYSLCFLGMSSIGGLVTGAMARLWGAPAAVLVGMAICVTVGVMVITRIIPIPSDPDSLPP